MNSLASAHCNTLFCEDSNVVVGHYGVAQGDIIAYGSQNKHNL